MKKDELLNRLSARIIECRKAKGWNQSDLARACNKDRQAIQKLETGLINPTVYSLHEIAQALDITISKLTNNLEENANS